MEKTNTSQVQAVFEAAFREYGLPERIRTDNGTPFATRALAGLSRLAVWWMKLGIVPERIEARHPEQNGRHERMHLTLQQGTAQPAAANRRAQQRVMDRFREEYNQVRPHEALQMETPAAVYHASPRKFPARLREPEYPDSMLVRRVGGQGQMQWKNHEVFVSDVLWGEPIGLLPINDRQYVLYFAQVPLALFSHRACVSVTAAQGKRLWNCCCRARRRFPFPCTPSPQPSGAETVRNTPGLNCQGCSSSHTTVSQDSLHQIAERVEHALWARPSH